MAGRLTLGLWNSYDPRRFREAHRRALARAGPLCVAYDANLATFGLPTGEVAGDVQSARVEDAGTGAGARGDASLGTPREIARFVAASTTVGADGELLVQLADDGRVQTFPFPDPGFPPQLGEIVLATRDPEDAKARTPRQVAASLLHDASTTLVVGLGPRGVPDDVRDAAAGHMDVTGSRTPLETATAMGACLASVDAWRTALRG